MSLPEDPRPAGFSPWSQAEEELRALVQPESAQVERLARSALAAAPAQSLRGAWRWAAGAAVGAFLAVLATAALHREPSLGPPQQSQEIHRSSPYQLVNTGGVVAVTNPSGQIQAIVARGES